MQSVSFFFLFQLFGSDGAGWADVAAFSATDAIHTVWLLPNGDLKFARLLTGTARSAFCGIHLIAVEGKAVEKTVDSAEGTKISAKGAAKNDRKQNYAAENEKFPAVEKADGVSQPPIHQNQGDPRL